MIRQFELVERLKTYDPSADEELLNRAYVFSMKAHGTQTRASGDPYFSHPLEVAGILTELRLDCYSIVTALLHDTVEDTLATIEEIEELFGPEIARLVDGVTKLSRLELQSEATRQAENFRKLVLAMSNDIRVLLVKLADRLHNMRTLEFVPIDKRKRVARETMEIYVPLAERMGMQGIKDELEDLAFAQLNTEARDSILSRLKFLHESSENAVSTIINELSEALTKSGINSQVMGREKTPYSIWQKMHKKNVAFEQLSDIMAFRIIVSTVPECYQALGVMHSNYLVIPGRFKDYISTPKPNKYQSLHTGLMGPLNHRIEMQIRTKDMNQISELGVAAHWQYKHDEEYHDGKQYAWLRGLLEILEQASGPEEFLEHTKLEMFQDQVFCFTPKGDLISLPKGSTSIDFAYEIHSAVGDRTVATKINGRQMPLRTILHNGDQVEIVTSKNQCPSPTWERFVVTGKARARIRKFVRSQQRQQFGELGKSMVHKAFIKEGIDFTDKNLSSVTHHFKHSHVEDLFAAVGQGVHTLKDVVVNTPGYVRKEDKNVNKFEEVLPIKEITKPSSKITHKTSLPIKGLIPGMALHFAGCCHPLPGDRIIGIVTTGSGVTIHTHDCEGVSSTIDPERILDLSWEDNLGAEERHVGRLKVIFFNKPGSLASMTTAISKQAANIVNLKVTHRTVEFWDLFVDVEVRNVEHLGVVQAALRAVPIINAVERI